MQNTPLTAQHSVQTNVKNSNDGISVQKTVESKKVRITLVASATIIRSQKISPLTKPLKPNIEVERPIAKQHSLKSGVPYIEFY